MSYSALNRPVNMHNYSPETPRRYTVWFHISNVPIITAIVQVLFCKTCNEGSVKYRLPITPSISRWIFSHREPRFQVLLVSERNGNIFRSKGRSLHLRLERDTLKTRHTLMSKCNLYTCHHTSSCNGEKHLFFHFHKEILLNVCHVILLSWCYWNNKMSLSDWNLKI